MGEPSVAIILSNYKGASIKFRGRSILDRCLTTLYRRTRYGNYVVIVADDESGDGSKALVSKVAPKADFIINKNCRSFSKNNNRAVEYALKRYRPDYFLLLNYDTIINDPDWLADIVRVAETDRNIGAVSPNLVFPNGRNQGGFGMRFHDRFSLRNLGKPDVNPKEFSKVMDAEVLPGVALLVRSSVVGKVGLLDENFLGGYEDVDYCLRIREKGMRVVYDGRVRIIHLQGYMRRADPSEEYKRKLDYSERRNQFYFLRKYTKKMGHARSMAWHLIYFANSVADHNMRLREHPATTLRIAMRAFSDAQKLKLPGN